MGYHGIVDTEVGKWMYEMVMRYPLSKSRLVHDMVYLLHVVSSCSYGYAMLKLYHVQLCTPYCSVNMVLMIASTC